MIEPLLVVQCIVSPSLFIFFHDLLRGCTYLRMGHSLQIQFNREDDDKAARFGLPGYPLLRQTCLPELGPVNFGQPLLLSVFNRQSSRFPTAPLSSPTKEWPGRLGLRLLLRCRPNTIVLVVYIHPNEKI